MRNRTRALVFFVLLSLVPFGQALGAQASRAQVFAYRQQSGDSYRQQFNDAVLDAIVTILIEDDNHTQAVGSGLIVRGDGLILTAYHLIKGARAVQVRLRNGETFERAEPVATDERRNVAVLRIPASGLYSLSGAVTEEVWVGSPVMVVSNATVEMKSAPAGILNSVSLSDEIAGAGTGYRVLKFTAPVLPGAAAGGLLVDEKGRALGLLAASPQAGVQTYAVPLSSLVGLVRAVGMQPAPVSQMASASTAPVPIPQNTVSVPQRPVSPLAPKGPGSVVVKPSRPVDVLLASKTIYVTTRTNFFKPEQLINELRKRTELDQWGLSFVDDVQVADLVLTLDHIVFTYKFTFTLSHQRTGVIVATGNVISWDGNVGSPQMARRVIEKLTQVRAQAQTK
jgi:S1-C subfamily serine protease